MKPLVLIGGGGHAGVVAAIAGKTGLYRIIGYTAPAAGAGPLDLPYLGDDAVLPYLAASRRAVGAVLGIGMVNTDNNRDALRRRLLSHGLSLPPVVSPAAVVNPRVVIGDGTVVLDGVVVNPGARIGECCIINTNATVEHDCTIGACSHVAPGAVLCGGVSVGNRSIIGANACVLPGIRVGDRCLVGAGATVAGDLTEPGVYLGSPARRWSGA